MKTTTFFWFMIFINLTGYSQNWDTINFSYEYQYEDSLFILNFVALPNSPISPTDYSIWGPDIDITAGNGAASQSEGIPNTNAIVEQLGDNGGTVYAAGYCKNMTLFGHSDWYLPSQMELYSACSVNNDLVGFFWSSTELSATTVMGVYSNNGAGTEIVEKDLLLGNCCVRRESQSYVGINSNTNNEHLKIIYTSDNGKVTVVLGDISGNQKITVYNIQGYKMYEESIIAGRKEYLKTLDVSQLPAGLYIITMKNGKTVKTGKFVCK